jgi:hypothetical protein
MRVVKRLAVLAAAVFVAMQLVPYGWKHSNPPVAADTPWPSDEARAIAVKSCYDCHSNQTDWRWYSYVAPSSWLVRRDVDRGRAELNFSEFGDDNNAMRDAAESVWRLEMPPRNYTLLHPDAKLTDDERRILLEALDELSERLRG